jgi:hypothetical protein
MAFKRFYDEFDLAKSLLVKGAIGTHGRTVRDIKEQVANDLTFIQKTVRGKFPGGQSDYQRILVDETFYKPLVRTSVFLGSDDPLVKKYFPEWAGTSHFPRLGTSLQVGDALRKDHEINGILIENHIVAMIWHPEYSGFEKFVLGTIEFVKFAAAVYSVATSFGAAVGSLVEVAHQVNAAAIAVIGLVKAAASSLGTGVGSALGAKENLDNLNAMRADNVSDTGLRSRGEIDATGGDWETRNPWRVQGQDLAALNYGDRENAVENEKLIRRMAFGVIQQIRPVRTSMEGGATVVTEEHGAAKYDVPIACRYTAKLEVAPQAVIRVGCTLRDVAAASVSAVQASKLEMLAFPWDNRGFVGSGAYFSQYIREDHDNTPALEFTFEKAPLPDPKWDGDHWIDTGERYPIELSLRPALTRVLGAIDHAEKQFLRIRSAQVRANNIGAALLGRARGRILERNQAAERQRQDAAQRRLGAMKRRLPSAQRFKEATYRGVFARRDPLLQTVDELLGIYDAVPDDDFEDRTVRLAVIEEYLTRYLRNKPQSTKRPIIEALLSDLRAEKRAIDNLSA